MKVDGTVILTSSGRYVNPLDLDPQKIVVEDIAHTLGNQCRYTGHTREFYSVAEHAVRVARWLEAQGEPLYIVQWGLLHDASEAYLVDMPRPLKVDPHFGQTYRGSEKRAMAVICDYFGLPRQMPDRVLEADVILLATERRDLMPPNGDWLILAGVEPLGARIVPWSPKKARAAFLAEFRRLFEEDV